MKEALACNKCKGIICADTIGDERVIGQVGTNRFVTFPERVEDCLKRKEVEIPTRKIFDQIPP